MEHEFYDEEIRAKPIRVLRSVEFNAQLADFLVEQDWPGDQIADWICDENYLHHKRRKFPPRGDEIDMDLVRIEKLLGEDPGRYFNAYKQRAKRGHSQRLSRPLIPRIMYLDFARTIWCGRNEIDL